MEEAYKAFSSDQVEQPDYIGIHHPSLRGEIDFKLGYYKANEIISMKAHSGGFTNNPAEHGVPNSIGTILLFDARSCAHGWKLDHRPQNGGVWSRLRQSTGEKERQDDRIDRHR